MYYTEQLMGGRGRRLIIAPLEVKFYLFGEAIINLRPRPPMFYSLSYFLSTKCRGVRRTDIFVDNLSRGE